MERARKDGTPILLLDSGDFLFKSRGKPHSKEEAVAVRSRAGAILRAYRKMGYDAVLPGGSDFAAGYPLLKEHEESGVPFTCLNLVSADGGRNVFPRSRTIARGGLRMLVVGVIGENAIPRDTLSGLGWKILPAEAALDAFLKGDGAAAADLVVVLARLSPGECLAVARSSPVPVILLSTPSRGGPAPSYPAGSAIFRSRKKGTHLLAVDVLSTGKIDRPGFVAEGTTVRLKEERRRLLAEMASMEERRLALYRKTLESYDAAIRDAEGKNELSYRWIPLDSAIPDDPQTASLLKGIRQESP